MPCCGPPKKCCSCTYYPPTQPDECRCGCGYHNGVFQVLLAQFLLFCGFWFSLAVLGDCSFVQIVEPIQVRQDGVMANKLGLLSYTEMDTGRCYYWTDIIPADNITDSSIPSFFSLYGDRQLEYYIEEVLGRQWYPTISLAATCAVVSFLWFLYVTTYCCSTQVWGVRMFTGFMIAVVFVTFQGLTFLILRSDWCDENECVPSRTAGFAYATIICFFLSGCAFFCMANYPGEKSLAKLQEEHHHHVMAGDEEAQPYVTPPIGEEEREDEPPEEDLLPGDEDYTEKPESAVPSSVPETSDHDDTKPESSAGGGVEQDGKSSEPVTAEAVLISDASQNTPKPPSDT